MTDQTATQFIMVPSDAIDRLAAKIDSLEQKLEGATVTPRDEWMTISDAAKKMGCSTATIKRRIETGAIQAKGSGKLRRVRLV